MTNVRPLTPPAPSAPSVQIGARYVPYGIERWDMRTGTYWAVHPRIEGDMALLQHCLLRGGALKFFDPVPGHWHSLRSPKKDSE